MINSPESSIVLPEDIQQAIEKGKNQVSLLQAETTRLIKLKIQQDKEMVVIRASQSDIESKIQATTSELEKITIEKDKVLVDLSLAQRQLEEIIKEENIVKDSIAIQKKEIADKTLQLEKDIDKFNTEKDIFNANVISLAKDTTVINEKKILLADILSKL